MSKEDIDFGLFLIIICLTFVIIGLGIVKQNNKYCEIEEHKKEWNCMTEEEIFKLEGDK